MAAADGRGWGVPGFDVVGLDEAGQKRNSPGPAGAGHNKSGNA